MSDQESAALVAVADEWNVAMCSNDAERIGDFMADDWVIVSESGVSTKAEFLGFVASGDLTHSTMDRVGSARVRFFGDVALFTTLIVNTAHYGGRQYDADEWTTDVFARRDGRWCCVLSHITPAVEAKIEDVEL